MQNVSLLSDFPVDRDDSYRCVDKFRYRHVLVATSLSIADRAALLLGFELASLHQSTLTLLDVAPRRKRERNVHGLDAIGLLHDAVEDLWGATRSRRVAEASQERLGKCLEGIVPPELLHAVSWRSESRWGDVADTIVSYVNESAADLVILSAKTFRSWLPLTPCAVRAVERRARANVIVIRSQAPSFAA
jgi:hypothetical protein